MFNWFKKKENKVQVAVVRPQVEVEVKPTIRMERVNKAVALYEETLRGYMADETMTKNRFNKHSKELYAKLKETVDSDLLTQEELDAISPRTVAINKALRIELHELVVARGTLGPAETPKVDKVKKKAKKKAAPVIVEERIIPDTKRGAPAGCYTYKNDRFALEDFREMFSRWSVAPEVSYDGE